MAAAVSDDTNRVPRVESYKHTNHEAVKNGAKPEREPSYYTIPRDEWEQTRSAYNAAEIVKSKIGNPRLVSVRPRVELGGGKQTTIVVDHRTLVPPKPPESEDAPDHRQKRKEPPVSIEVIRRRTPDTVPATVEQSGETKRVATLPVRVRQTVVQQTAVYDGLYRPVPAGCQMRTGDFGRGTLCAPAYDLTSDRPGWFTAGHVLDRDSGKDVYQPDNCCTTLIGQSIRATQYGNGDSGLIASDGESRKYDVADKGNNNYMGWDIFGIVAEDKARDMAANKTYIYRQGSTTGRNAIRVKELDSDPALVFAGDGNDEKGDSGGPYFLQNDDNDGWLILGNHQGHADRCIGTAAFYAESELNFVL
jgi:hypothetical protein